LRLDVLPFTNIKEILQRSVVIIPTYNECENVEAIAHAVLDQPHGFHVLIVDDGSPDGTADIVKRLQATTFQGRLHLIQRTGKLGLGTAYIAGFKWALEQGYDFVFEMDADFSHDPQDLPRLLEACTAHGADAAVGSRYCKGGGVVNWPFDRIFLSRGASLYVQGVLWMPVTDPTAGFIVYTRKVLETIDLDQIKFIGYAFQIEMKYAAYRLGFKIKEVPILFKDREKGQSKMSLKIIKEAILGVLKMRWTAFRRKKQ
jgi:dolichol-phosphate mannosyltransferase